MKRNDPPPTTCENCGGLLEPTRQFIKNPQRFCSDKCRSNYHNDKNRGYTKSIIENTKPLTEVKILKCPYCNTDSSQSGMIEQVSSTQYLCNCCSKISEISLSILKNPT